MQLRKMPQTSTSTHETACVVTQTSVLIFTALKANITT